MSGCSVVFSVTPSFPVFSVKSPSSSATTAPGSITIRVWFDAMTRTFTGLSLNMLKSTRDKLWSLAEMERTGGEPDVVGHEKKSGEFVFMDCAPESPAGRRGVCFDRQKLDVVNQKRSNL
jgi:hypothetical protein